MRRCTVFTAILECAIAEVAVRTLALVMCAALPIGLGLAADTPARIPTVVTTNLKPRPEQPARFAALLTVPWRATDVQPTQDCELGDYEYRDVRARADRPIHVCYARPKNAWRVARILF